MISTTKLMLRRVIVVAASLTLVPIFLGTISMSGGYFGDGEFRMVHVPGFCRRGN